MVNDQIRSLESGGAGWEDEPARTSEGLEILPGQNRACGFCGERLHYGTCDAMRAEQQRNDPKRGDPVPITRPGADPTRRMAVIALGSGVPASTAAALAMSGLSVITHEELRKEPIGKGPGATTGNAAEPEGDTGPMPPRRLSNDPNHADFHPGYLRVGVIVDGQERTDCCWYDADRGRYRTVDMGRHAPPLEAHTIKPFWRWAESRQERRARERWEGKRK